MAGVRARLSRSRFSLRSRSCLRSWRAGRWISCRGEGSRMTDPETADALPAVLKDEGAGATDRKRRFGLDAGKVVIREDFDDPMPELERIFYGEESGGESRLQSSEPRRGGGM